MDNDVEGKSWDFGVRSTKIIPTQPLLAVGPLAAILSFLLICKMRIIIPASQVESNKSMFIKCNWHSRCSASIL